MHTHFKTTRSVAMSLPRRFSAGTSRKLNGVLVASATSEFPSSLTATKVVGLTADPSLDRLS